MSGTDTIQEDDRDVWTSGAEKRTTTLTIADNVIRWKSSSGRTGTVIFDEGGGKRVLIWTYDQNPGWMGQSIPKF